MNCKTLVVAIYFSDPRATPTDLARRFHVSRRTVHRWINEAKTAGCTFGFEAGGEES